MKIAVYSICKNDSKFVLNWYNSMKEADSIYVLDTGSTDGTYDELKKLGVNVKTVIISPFRYDTVRNLALEMLPDDVDLCVATNLDEVFNKGWRRELENNYHGENRIIYNYSFHDHKDIKAYSSKIHTRHNYTWIYPIHETLKSQNKLETKTIINSITLTKYSNTIDKNYLSLLELAVLENKNDYKNRFYLGYYYLNNKKEQEAIDIFLNYLTFKNTSAYERALAMRFIGRSYFKLKRYNEALMWYKKAITKAPLIKNHYIEIAFLYYKLENYKKVYLYLKEALKITRTSELDFFLYDLMSLACYYLKLLPQSLIYIDKCLEISPNNKRIKNNKILIEKILNNLK